MSDDSNQDFQQIWVDLQNSLYDPDALADYLLIGYYINSLAKYELIPEIRRNLGENWIKFFLQLAEKAANSETRILFGKTIPYSILNEEIKIGLDLMSQFGKVQGFEFNSLSNINDVYLYYIGHQFEAFLNSKMKEASN